MLGRLLRAPRSPRTLRPKKLYRPRQDWADRKSDRRRRRRLHPYLEGVVVVAALAGILWLLSAGLRAEEERVPAAVSLLAGTMVDLEVEAEWEGRGL